MSDCISCHSENPESGIPQILIAEFKASIHGSMMTCAECHSYIEEGHEAGDVDEKVNCNMCHQQANLHGATANAGSRPECYTCHTKHSILPSHFEKSTVNRAHLEERCSECHEAQYGKSVYMKGFTSFRIRSHKKEDFSREFNETNCIGCHQGMAIHGTAEKISADDCAKCHMKDNKNAMMGRFHAAANSGLSINGLSIITQILLLGVLILVIRFIVKAPWKQCKRGKF
ncbi:MAG: hypothetical protein JW927_09700 [Deltaproteobacteria bacterium]|nr:hypothetical protein [Deltaproteobacteria bacterium]